MNTDYDPDTPRRTRRTPQSRVILAVTITTAVLLGSAAAAPAAVADDATGDVVAAALADAAPQALPGSAASVATDADSAATTTVAGTTVDVPRDPADGIGLTGAGGTAVTIDVPNAGSASDATAVAPAAVAYDNHDGSVTVPVVKADASVQINTVIVDSAAPTQYQYPVTVGDGGSMALNADGSVSILDAAGTYVGGVAKPWATDANGNPVATHFTVNGAALVQTVEHTATSGVAYPVVADPWFGIRLIDRVAWSGATLQVFPTTWGRYWAGYAARWSAWDEVVSKAPGANRANMRDQFYCHWDVVRLRAPNKVSWNLDSTRPDVGYWTTVNRSCNP